MLTRLCAVVRGLLRRRAIALEVDEKLAFHLEREAARHEALGVSPVEARRLAALQLGHTSVVRSDVADVRTTWLDTLSRELGTGLRTLVGTPSFTGPALLVLALGIASTTTIASVIEGALLRPLPFAAPDELFRVWSRHDERRSAFLSVSPADFEDWRARTLATLRLAAYERPVTLPPDDATEEPVTLLRVSAELFGLLGVAPALGRTFEPADVHAPVAVVSHGFWQRRYGGAADVIGRSVRLGRKTVHIVGVMPPRFQVPNAVADLWVPLDTNLGAPARTAHMLRVLARYCGQPSAALVQRDLDVVAAQLAKERPADNAGWRVTVQPLFDTVISPDLRRSLWLTAGAVLLLLLLAVTSVAGLVLVRSTGRARELAVRVALGASRGSLVRLLLLECLVVAVVAGGLGLLAAVWGTTLLRETGDALVPRLDEVRVNGRIFAVTAAVSVVAALLAGVVPTWRSTRSLHDRLRQRGGASDPTSGRTLPCLVVVELSTAVLLVVGAALLVQTVINLHARPLGFDSAAVISMTSSAPLGFDEPQRLIQLQRVLDRVSATPGVAGVAAGSALPLAGQNSGNTFEIEGQPVLSSQLPNTDTSAST